MWTGVKLGVSSTWQTSCAVQNLLPAFATMQAGRSFKCPPQPLMLSEKRSTKNTAMSVAGTRPPNCRSSANSPVVTFQVQVPSICSSALAFAGSRNRLWPLANSTLMPNCA